MNCHIRIFFLAIAIILVAANCKRSDTGQGWKTYRHDAKRTGVTAEKLPSRLSLNWTYIPVHSPEPLWSMPAEEMPRMHLDNTYHVSAANGLAYFCSSVDNKVYALDINTGKERWTYFAEGPVRFSPTIWNRRIYFGSDDRFCLTRDCTIAPVAFVKPAASQQGTG